MSKLSRKQTPSAFLKRLVLFLLCAIATACVEPVARQNKGEVIRLADPTIFYHEGTNYLYGTGPTSKGILVYTSPDGKHWEGPKGVNNGFALEEKDAFGDRGFWAPQVFQYQGKFYMAYTANESIAIAESNNPLGPFAQREKKPLEAPVKLIDPFAFIDDNGMKYLYHVRVANGGNKIFVAEMEDDFSGIKEETLQECIQATETWENIENAKWSVTEGPSVLKHKEHYFLVYSANHFRSPDYAVGYATSKSPYGPWEKYDGNPILRREQIGHNGTGHGDFFWDEDGTLNYVFHTHQSDSAVGSRKTAVVQARFAKPEGENTSAPAQIKIDEDSFSYLRKVE